jgi:hypothetical protein
VKTAPPAVKPTPVVPFTGRRRRLAEGSALRAVEDQAGIDIEGLLLVVADFPVHGQLTSTIALGLAVDVRCTISQTSSRASSGSGWRRRSRPRPA